MAQVSTRMRPTTTGFIICIHTCVQSGCPNASGNILWQKYGNSLRKHATNPNRHPFCNTTCPGYHALHHFPGGRFLFSRESTNIDFQGLLQLDPMDVDEPQTMTPSTSPHPPSLDEIAEVDSSTRDSTPYTNMSSVADMDTDLRILDDRYRNQISVQNSPCFKIIYVPDPTRATTPALASADLAFIKTTITPHEYEQMKHLTGSIHLTGRSGGSRDTEKIGVYMQEWVRKIFFYSNLILSLLKCLCLYYSFV
jgi:hypothetical protein